MGLQDGTVDMVIGTHRLLQKDVAFKDLGLVIIDEEQRFGVAHKERLKQLRREVDVLTLTATPIPRTLHMSLAGVRDMSTIETPPEDRLPIVTIVHEYDDTLVRVEVLVGVARFHGGRGSRLAPAHHVPHPRLDHMVIGNDVAGGQHHPAAQPRQFTLLIIGLDHHHRVFYLLVNLAGGERQRRLRQSCTQGQEQGPKLTKNRQL